MGMSTAPQLDPNAAKWLAKAKPPVIRDFLTLFIPAALLLLALIAGYHYADNRRAQEAIFAAERGRIALAEQTLNTEMDNTIADLRILGRNNALKQALDDPDNADSRSPLIRVFSDHIEEIGNFDYIALLNAMNRELVRVKGTTGTPVTDYSSSSPPLGEQAFVRGLLDTPPKTIRISRPLLDAEASNKQRFWPTLLFGMAVNGANPDNKGALLISYPIATLTMQLDGIFVGAAGHVSVLNGSGHWLYDQVRQEDEWGNMFKENRNFASTRPNIWQKIQASATGQVADDNGVYLFSTVYPLAKQRLNRSEWAVNREGETWKIVSFINNATLDTWRQRASANIPFYLLFLGILGVALWHRAQSKASQKLVDEATRLAAKVMDSRAAAIFISDASGRMLAVNPTLLRLTGYDESELLFQNKRLFAPEGTDGPPPPSFWDGIAKHLELEGEWEGEILCRRRNGEYFPAYLLVGLTRDSRQQATHYVAILNDITARKQSEEALRESQSRFRQLIDQASDGIYLMDMDGLFLDVNQQACQALGYSREELLALHVWDIETDYSADYLRSVFRQLQMGIPRTFYGTHRRKDGTRYPVEARSGLTIVGGKPHVLALVRDITEREAAERALRESEASLAKAQQIAKLGNWDWDVAKDEIQWSDETYRIFGYKKSDLGVTLADALNVVHPDDVEQVTQGITQTLAGLAPYNLDHRIILPDGTVRHVHEQAETLFDGEGRAVRMIGTVQDITERKVAEESLRATHDMFVTVMDSMEALVYVADMDSHEILFANRYTRDTFNIPDMTGKICWQTLQGGQTGPCSFCTNSQLLTPLGEPGESCIWEFQNTVSHRWFHIHDRAIRWIDGRIVRLEIATDISSIKETEAALRESRANLNKAQEIAHVGNWEWLVEKKKTRWSEEIYRIVGLPVPEGIAEEHLLDDEDVANAVHPQDRQILYDARQSALEGKAPYNHEFRVSRPSGETRIVHVMGEVLRDAAGKPVSMIGTIQDITERKLLDTLQRRHQRELEHAARLSIVGEMASGLAHELSQPLAAAHNYIRGCIRRLQSPATDPTTILDALRLASTQTERAGDIISHLKEFARKREPVACLLDLRQVTREVLLLLEQELKKNQVTVTLDFPPGDSANIVMDKVELEQVMVNLIKNASEAMQDQETREIAVHAEVLGDDLVQVDVADTGPGIPPGRIGEIFNPFFTTKQEGMGLGLSISHSIIESHGGRMWATNNPHGGTTFHFTLRRNVEPGFVDEKSEASTNRERT